MPFIDVKVTTELSKDKKDELKSELGRAISLLGKSEAYLMVGIEDNYTLYFGGKELEKGAYIAVSLLGSVDSSKSNALTGKICEITSKVLGIPGNAVYVTYQGIRDWGYNGGNF